MLRASLKRLAEAGPKLTLHNNPYKAQKQWPPDFSKLHPKHQFRFERKYRRRSKLKWERPRWVKGVKLAAWGSSLCVNPSQYLGSRFSLIAQSCAGLRGAFLGLG